MSALPPGWLRTTLAQACEKVTDGTHHSPTSYPAGPFMYVTAKNVRRHGLDFTDITYVDEATHKDIYSRAPVQLGDVLYIKDGATTGLAAVNQETEPFSILSSLALLKPHRELLEGHYLSYWLNSPDVRERMIGEMGGSAIKRLTLAKITPQAIELPPLAEQRRIVAKIDALTARSKRARAELSKTRTLSALIRDAVLEALAREPDEIEGWRRHPVGEIATSFDGPFGSHLKGSDYVETGVRVIRLENVGRLRFIEDKRTYVSAEKGEALLRHELAADDVLVSSFMDDGVRVALMPPLSGRAINKADVFCLRVNRDLCEPSFLAYKLACPSTFEKLNAVVHGATRPRISLSQLRALKLCLPPLPEQRAIVARIETAFAALDRVEAEAKAAERALDRLDQAILAKAFRGELVPQDSADEPASALLARIAAERAAAPKAVRSRRNATIA